MKKVVYAVVYNDPSLFDEWFNTLNEAITSASYSGASVYIALIPSQSRNFYDIGEKMNCVAVVQSPYKWRIKNA